MAFNVNYHYYNGISIQIRRIFSKITPTANKFHRCNGNEIEKKKETVVQTNNARGRTVAFEISVCCFAVERTKKKQQQRNWNLTWCSFGSVHVSISICWLFHSTFPHFHILQTMNAPYSHQKCFDAEKLKCWNGNLFLSKHLPLPLWLLHLKRMNPELKPTIRLQIESTIVCMFISKIFNWHIDLPRG